jgi:hypothetical protein
MVSHLLDAFFERVLVFQEWSYVPENYAFELGYSPYFRFEIQFSSFTP